MRTETPATTNRETAPLWTAVLDCGPDPEGFLRRLPALAGALVALGSGTDWWSAAVPVAPVPAAPPGWPLPLARHSRILAVVPHYRCEPWLEQCLRSLLSQTRPPNGVVVIDDGSETPP